MNSTTEEALQQEDNGHYFVGPAAVNIDTAGTLAGYTQRTSMRQYQVNVIQKDTRIDESEEFSKKNTQTSQLKQVKYVESGDRINSSTAVLILLSISFGVGYLFLPLSFFVQQTIVSSALLIFNFISGFIAVYMLMDLRAQTNLGSYQEVAYYMSGSRSTILAISALFGIFFIINCSVYIQLISFFIQRFFETVLKVKTLFPFSLQVITIVVGSALIPFCRVLNFQKFKFLTFPILGTILIIFLCLIFNLTSRVLSSKEYRDDFCTIMPNDSLTIPSQDIGVTYATVIPSLCFAFGFHIYVLQVTKVMDRPDPNGHLGMRVGLWTLLITFILYASLLIVSALYEEPHSKAHVILVFDVVVNSRSYFEYFAQVLVIIQLFCHTPFAFYIAQEQVMMFIDELKRRSISSMIDEAKQVDGNRKQKKYVMQEERLMMSIDNETLIGDQNKKRRKSMYQVTTYRLPYMTMPKKTLDRIFWSLYALIMILAILQIQWFVNSVSTFGATCVPLSLYVIPGYYYGQYYKGYENKKYWSGMIFAIFGIGIMVTYTALEFFSFAYVNEQN